MTRFHRPSSFRIAAAIVGVGSFGLLAASGSSALAQAGSPTGGPGAKALVNPVAAAGGGGPAAAPAGKLTLDQVLDLLDQRGQNLNSFAGDVTLVERDESTALETTRIGKIWYQRLPDGQARIRVSFTEKQNGKTRAAEAKDYVLDAGWLVERDHARKIEIRRQVLKPGQKMDLFRLGDGPFPMPIGQKKEDVKKQFGVELLPLTPEDKLLDEKMPVDVCHVVLKPRSDNELKRQFSAIDVFVDPKSQMPVRIDTLDAKEERSRSTALRNLQVNPPLRDVDFALPKIDKSAGWQEQVEQMK